MTTRFPEWIRRSWGSPEDFGPTKDVLQDLRLHTVCRSAKCPNIGECWTQHTATVMILGNVCTRKCSFCAVSTGIPDPVETDEPRRVAEAANRLALRHAVITSVTRDDLTDGGAEIFAVTIEAIRHLNSETTVEVLVPDFQGAPDSVRRVMSARPDVFGHNIETVRRLHPVLRDARYRYERSLEVLRMAAERNDGAVIKSAFMLGLGESEEDVEETLHELLSAGCQAVSIGQYLRPTPNEREVASFVTPEQFQAYEQRARQLGFAYAVAGPFVRSSYRSGEMMRMLKAC